MRRRILLDHIRKLPSKGKAENNRLCADAKEHIELVLWKERFVRQRVNICRRIKEDR